MKITTAAPEDFMAIYEFVGDIEELVQLPRHFYRVMLLHFGDSIFVARDQGAIVGFALGFVSQRHPDVFFMYQIGVAAPYRGRGIAQELIRHAEDYAREHGCSRMWGTVETGNMQSRRFFEKLGCRNVSSPEHGEVIVEDGTPALHNYYGTGTDQVLYEKKVTSR